MRRSYHTNLHLRSPNTKKPFFSLFQKSKSYKLKEYYNFLNDYLKYHNNSNCNNKNITQFEKESLSQINNYLVNYNKKTFLDIDFSILSKMNNKDIQSQLNLNSTIPDQIKHPFNHHYMSTNALLYDINNKKVISSKLSIPFGSSPKESFIGDTDTKHSLLYPYF
jgi:hypothetical protein